MQIGVVFPTLEITDSGAIRAEEVQVVVSTISRNTGNEPSL